MLRRSVVCACSALLSVTLQAQIYDGTSFPVVGTTYNMYSDTTAYGLNSGLVTGSAPWYLVSIGYDYVDDIEFETPSNLPFGDQFPGADIGIIDSSNRDFFVTNYLSHTGNGYELVGGLVQAPSGTLLPMVFDEPLTWLSLPLSVGASYRDTASGRIYATGAQVGFPVDSLMLHRTIIRFDTIDAVGDLTVPGLILNNAIRRITRDSIIDSIFVKLNGIWSFEPDGEEGSGKAYKSIEWYHPDKSWMVAQANIQVDPTYGEQLRTWRYMVGPPPSTRVQFEGLPSDVSILDTVDFSVSVRSVASGELVTNFSDSLRIGVFPDTSWGWMYWQVDERSVLPQGGIANFENLWFHQPGTYQLLAWSDTTLSDTSTVITVHPIASRIQLDATILSVAESQTLPVINASVLNDSGYVDAFFYSGLIRVGKLSGPGELLGTKDAVLNGGFASFSDLKLTKAGSYQLIFYVPLGQYYLVQDTLSVNVIANNGTWEYAFTDTLEEYVARANEFVWFGNADGYLSGTSRGGFAEVGQQFDFSGTARLTEVLIYFANRFEVGDNSDIYKVKVYSVGLNRSDQFPYQPTSFLDSLPLELLGSQEFLADSMLFGDFWIRRPTSIPFDNPPVINSNFIVSVETDSEFSNDTIIIWHSIIGDGEQEYRTSKLFTGWGIEGTDTFWIRDKFWRPSFDVDLMISPVLEIDTVQLLVSVSDINSVDIRLGPNPTFGLINVQFSRGFSGVIELYDEIGRRLISRPVNKPETMMAIDLQEFKPEHYLFVFRDETGKLLYSEKIILIKP